MANVYYYLVMLNAVFSAAVAVVVFIRNRYQLMGPVFSAGMLMVAAWLFCFAHYFQALPPEPALWWAKCTLTLAIVNHAFFLHSFSLLVNQARRFRWWILTSYLVGVFFAVLLWQGQLVTGLKSLTFMDHYVRYNRTWYPLLGLHLVVWEFLAIWLLVKAAWTATGYLRTQLIYFITVWSIMFLNTSSIIIPLEYDIAIPPFGFFITPLNLAFLTYVMAKARLQDFNVVLARVLSLTIMLLVVVATTLLFIGSLAVVIFSYGYFLRSPLFQIIGSLLPLGYVLWLLLKPSSSEEFLGDTEELDAQGIDSHWVRDDGFRKLSVELGL